MDLTKIFEPRNCLILEENRKTEVLMEMIKSLVASGRVSDEEGLAKQIFYREQLMSTGIGLGIGVPHVRFKGISEPAAALGICPRGISDYESIDDFPVKLVLMILVGENQHKQHLRLLSQVMEKLKSARLKQDLLNAQTPEELYTLITQ